MEQRIDFPVVFEETGRKSFNGTFQDNFGNYMGMYSLGFFFVTIWQVLASKLQALQIRMANFTNQLDLTSSCLR